MSNYSDGLRDARLGDIDRDRYATCADYYNAVNSYLSSKRSRDNEHKEADHSSRAA